MFWNDRRYTFWNLRFKHRGMQLGSIGTQYRSLLVFRVAGDVFIRECKPFPNRDTESWAVGLPLVASGLRPFCLSSIMSLSGCHIGVKSVSSRLSGCHSGRFQLFNVQTIFMNSMGPSVFPTHYPLYVWIQTDSCEASAIGDCFVVSNMLYFETYTSTAEFEMYGISVRADVR